MIFRRAICASFLGFGAITGASAQSAQDVPPRDVLAAIVHQITGKPPHTAITFQKRTGAVDDLCRLEPAQMNLTRNGSSVRSFSVLVDHVSGAEAPSQFFATLPRVA